MKVKKVTIGSKGEFQWQIMCPGCKFIHAISPKIHQFNGDIECPTFTPSLNANWNNEQICHSYITDGNIEFLGDCWHDLKNKKVGLPEII